MPGSGSRSLMVAGLSGPGFAADPAGTVPGTGASRPLYPGNYTLLCSMGVLCTAAGRRSASTDGGCYDGGPGPGIHSLSRAIHDLTRLGTGHAGAEGRGDRPYAAQRGHVSVRGRRNASALVFRAIR